MNPKDIALLCDYYEYTMVNAYFANGLADRVVYFDIFFRRLPDDGGFAIFAGLEQFVEYVRDLRFSESDVEFLRRKGIFREEFLDFLRGFRFTGDVWAVPEGTPVFPGEPLITIRARAVEAQILETFSLLTINHQSLIATKANRFVRAAQGRKVMEFGSRRAQGGDAAVYGARAAYIGGCVGTACALSDKIFNVPANGTMAHSWVQMFDSEYDAFLAFCRTYPVRPIVLVDTYDTLNSGVPNAIRVFKELGIVEGGIRLDSGDLSFLAKRARRMLDDAGLNGIGITVSNSLDEWLIHDLIEQGAPIDSFGVGEKLITAESDPVFNGVFKLVAVEDDSGNITPRIKLSECVGKITIPHFKKPYRLFDRDGKALADLICVHDESVDDSEPLTIFDPSATWKRKTLTDFTAKELMVPIFKGGELVYNLPPLDAIRGHCAEQVGLLWDEVKRFSNPHRYYVDLSERLWEIRDGMIRRP